MQGAYYPSDEEFYPHYNYNYHATLEDIGGIRFDDLFDQSNVFTHIRMRLLLLDAVFLSDQATRINLLPVGSEDIQKKLFDHFKKRANIKPFNLLVEEANTNENDEESEKREKDEHTGGKHKFTTVQQGRLGKDKSLYDLFGEKLLSHVDWLAMMFSDQKSIDRFLHLLARMQPTKIQIKPASRYHPPKLNAERNLLVSYHLLSYRCL